MKQAKFALVTDVFLSRCLMQLQFVRRVCPAEAPEGNPDRGRHEQSCRSFIENRQLICGLRRRVETKKN